MNYAGFCHKAELRYNYDLVEYWTTDGKEMFVITKENNVAFADELQPLTYLLGIRIIT